MASQWALLHEELHEEAVMSDDPANQMLDDAQVAALLAEEASRHFPDGKVENVEKMSGGASRETWSFDVVQADGDRLGLILRRDPGNTGSSGEEGWRGGKTTYSLDRTTEAQLQRAVYEAGGLSPKSTLQSQKTTLWVTAT